MKRHVVRLEAEERARLDQLVRRGKGAALRIRHANILLAVDESKVWQWLPASIFTGKMPVPHS